MENTIDNARKFCKSEDIKTLGLARSMFLYAASVKPDGWRVKELEWEQRKGDEWKSQPIAGIDWFYWVMRINKRYYFNHQPFDSLDLAKAAANADYLERIGQALEPC